MIADGLPVFDRIPEGMATLNQLLGERLVLSSKQKAIAKVRFTFSRKHWNEVMLRKELVATEKLVNLYLHNDARPMTSPLQRAEMDYYDIFIAPARQDRHIATGSGQPVMVNGKHFLDQDGETIWDDGYWAVNEDGEYIFDDHGGLIRTDDQREVGGKWRWVEARISRCMVKGHIGGSSCLGVFGGERRGISSLIWISMRVIPTSLGGD